MLPRRTAWLLSCGIVTLPAIGRGQAIRGRLIEAVSRAPVPGGRLELLDAGGRVIASAQTSGSGAFQLVAPASGRYRYRAAAIGYKPVSPVDVAVTDSDVVLGDVLITGGASRRLPDLVATAHSTLTWTSHFYRLWDAVTGNVVAVVAYALRYRNLIASGSGPHRNASVYLTFHQGYGPGGRNRDTLIARTVRIPDDSTIESIENGFFVVPSAAEITDWTLIVTQPERMAGGDWEYARQPIAAGPLALSDLVLGAESHHLQWDNHGDRVVLASREPIDASDTIALYYQVKSAVDRPSVHVDVAVYQTDKGVKSPAPVFHVAFDSTVTAGIGAIHRTLGLAGLQQGRYRVEVQVVDRAMKLAAQQAVTFYLQ
jgi:hypothetical protein